MSKTLRQLIVEDIFENQEPFKTDLELGNAGSVTGETYFYWIVDGYYRTTEYPTIPNIFKTETINTLFCTYIYPKYADMHIGDESTFLRHLINRIVTSSGEFNKLIDLYDEIEDNLLDDIKSVTKFNDTPQTESTGVYDDSYNSTVTTNLTEGASKISRLAEVEALIKDYYEQWADKVCKGLFIYE